MYGVTDNKKKISFLISHRPDNRYLKRINLVKTNYELNLIFWNKSDELINPCIDEVAINEIHIIADQTNPLKRLPETGAFICRAYKELCKEKPDIVYVGNLDMLHIARKYKHKRNSDAKIIYEIADLHRLIIDKQKGLKRLLSYVLKLTEKIYIKDVNTLVLTSMKFYDIYYRDLIDRTKVVFLPNMPEEATFDGYIPKDRTGEPFTVGFIGWMRYKDQLRMLIDAASKSRCSVLFAGADGEGLEFKEYCKNYSYVQYLGSFNYNDKIRELYDMVDCIYAVYDADLTNVRIALPNKLYEAILCEKPIIVAKNTYLGELVNEYGIGAETDHHSEAELIEIIDRMKNDRVYYNTLIENCKRAKVFVSLNKYNDDLLEAINHY